jgi:uracil-DNA glycosylase family 4
MKNIIDSCNKCSLHSLDINKKDIKKGYGKLYGWKIGDEIKYIFVGMNPSYNRFEGLEYTFGGYDFNKGTGIEFIKLLKDIDVLKDSYITNVVKCSSFDNKIKSENVKSCLEIFKEEIKENNPKMIIALGNDVYDFLINENLGVEIIKIWHPNYVFSYNREKINDYKKIIEELCND